MNIEIFKLVNPTEENRFCVFDADLENDGSVFFHMTLAKNMHSIIEGGFKSAKDLGTGSLESVSYAKTSSGCFANLVFDKTEDWVVFAVRFTTAQLDDVYLTQSEIQVYRNNIQPQIIGVVHLPRGFRLP
ncbi:hypothetical protein N5K37_27460 [Delftia tsuruhatensis]|jgi:hypothetical protein|uniref:hypothetical protein n=1 Tax=Delftia TaxID=80865 RepID=UPI001177510D|nr:MULTISPECIES: hypothetical protein [Delftia]MDH2233657.1 hypothetical protein [Delftia tsuruhatensis]